MTGPGSASNAKLDRVCVGASSEAPVQAHPQPPAPCPYCIPHCSDHESVSAGPPNYCSPSVPRSGVTGWPRWHSGATPAVMLRGCDGMTVQLAASTFLGQRGQGGRPARSHCPAVIAVLSFCLENEEGSGREMKSVPSGKEGLVGEILLSLGNLPHRHARQPRCRADCILAGGLGP